jgi:hypothetical protein
MGLNAWLRSHPLIYALIGAAIAALGVVRGQPIAIAAGVFVVLYGLARAFVF